MPPLFRANADSRTNTKFLRQLSGQAPRRREVSKAEEFFAQNQVFPLDKIQEPQNALSRPIGRRFWNQGLSGFGGSGSERRREAGADDRRASGHCRAREQRTREGGAARPATNAAAVSSKVFIVVTTSTTSLRSVAPPTPSNGAVHRAGAPGRRRYGRAAGSR